MNADTNMTDDERIALIKAHTLHEKIYTPHSVHVRDKLFLLNKIEELKKQIVRPTIP